MLYLKLRQRISVYAIYVSLIGCMAMIPCFASSQIHPDDYNALVKILNDNCDNCPLDTEENGWLPSNPIENWRGLGLNHPAGGGLRRVVSLEISSLGLVGELDLDGLPYLEMLQCEGNQLTQIKATQPLAYLTTFFLFAQRNHRTTQSGFSGIFS